MIFHQVLCRWFISRRLCSSSAAAAELLSLRQYWPVRRYVAVYRTQLLGLFEIELVPPPTRCAFFCDETRQLMCILFSSSSDSFPLCPRDRPTGRSINETSPLVSSFFVSFSFYAVTLLWTSPPKSPQFASSLYTTSPSSLSQPSPQYVCLDNARGPAAVATTAAAASVYTNTTVLFCFVFFFCPFPCFSA